MLRAREVLTAVFASVVVAATLAACAPPAGTKRDVLSRPLRDDYVQLVTVTDRLVEVDSAGSVVRAEAPEGHCIPTDSIQTLGQSVFMLIEGCAGGRSEFPGVVSVSIANGPMRANLAALASILRTEGGTTQLGYGGGTEDVTLLDLTRQDGALYATVEDLSEFGPAFAGDQLCRAFMELNGRMVVATIISRRDHPQEAAALRADLVRVVRTLRRANDAADLS